MTSPQQQKIVQYLDEAHATELALTRVLQSQIAMTPRGSYRSALETHLIETREHADRVGRRLTALDAGGNPLQVVAGLLGQLIALGKTPLDLLRGSGGEEKVLKNAKDAAATEALEIATYTALERLANAVGDDQTADLAASIRADEEKMLERILRELPKLTDAVVRADIDGDRSYNLATTGAVETVKQATNGDEPWAGYDKRTAAEVQKRLSAGNDELAAKVRSYERAHKNRAGVLKAAGRQHANA